MDIFQFGIISIGLLSNWLVLVWQFFNWTVSNLPFFLDTLKIHISQFCIFSIGYFQICLFKKWILSILTFFQLETFKFDICKLDTFNCDIFQFGIFSIFMQLGFNLSNGVTNTLESSSILIYLEICKSIYTQQSGEMPYLIKWLIKR